MKSPRYIFLLMGLLFCLPAHAEVKYDFMPSIKDPVVEKMISDYAVLSKDLWLIESCSNGTGKKISSEVEESSAHAQLAAVERLKKEFNVNFTEAKQMLQKISMLSSNDAIKELYGPEKKFSCKEMKNKMEETALAAKEFSQTYQDSNGASQ